VIRVSLCLFTFNELPGCRRDVPAIARETFHEVFCIDAHSTDGTIEYLEGCGIPVHRQPRLGLTAAYAYAAEVATGDALVVFFPKGTIPVESLLEIKVRLEEGFELVIASRNIVGSRNEEDDAWIKPRKWFVLGLGRIVSLLWRREGVRITDLLHGVKGFTLRAFEAMHIEPEGQEIDLAMGIRSYKLGLKRCEVPVRERSRFYGATHFKALPSGMRLLKFLCGEILGTNRGSAAADRRVNA